MLPHYSTARHERAQTIASRLSAATVLLGLPETCGVSGAGSALQVLGAGDIHVWQKGAARKLAAGETQRVAYRRLGTRSPLDGGESARTVRSATLGDGSMITRWP